MRLSFTVVSLLLLGVPALARATPNFPPGIAQALSCKPPDCSICHAGGVTGRGTVTTAFGRAMIARGLVANDETALQNALARLQADKVDSNDNGIPDVDELRAGKDPSLSSSTPPVGYGCAVGAAEDAGLLTSLLIPVLLLRRRREGQGARTGAADRRASSAAGR